MSKPAVHLGQNLACRKCQHEFVCAHPRQRYCTKKCARADKENRENRKQKKQAQQKRWREKNFLQIKAKRKQCYQENKTQILAKTKAWRDALPPEVRREKQKRYQLAHKDREVKRYHATRVWLPWLNAFRGSKQRATKHNVAFTITKEWAIARWTGRCEVTGIEFILSTKRSPYLFSPSLDRIIPTLGYTPENSRFVLHAVNALKGQGTDTDMLRIAQAIVQNAALAEDKL